MSILCYVTNDDLVHSFGRHLLLGRMFKLSWGRGTEREMERNEGLICLSPSDPEAFFSLAVSFSFSVWENNVFIVGRNTFCSERKPVESTDA